MPSITREWSSEMKYTQKMMIAIIMYLLALTRRNVLKPILFYVMRQLGNLMAGISNATKCLWETDILFKAV